MPDDEAPEAETDVAIGLGSNLGDRRANLVRAVDRLARAGRVTALSSIYESPPAGFEDQPDFLNMVVTLRTRLEPAALMRVALEVEADAGRRRTFPNAPRTIDVDLILYGERVVEVEGLSVPHPRWRDRAFVLAPLREVAPGWWDPVTGRTVEALAEEALPAAGPVRRVAPPPVPGAGGEGAGGEE